MSIGATRSAGRGPLSTQATSSSSDPTSRSMSPRRCPAASIARMAGWASSPPPAPDPTVAPRSPSSRSRRARARPSTSPRSPPGPPTRRSSGHSTRASSSRSANPATSSTAPEAARRPPGRAARAAAATARSRPAPIDTPSASVTISSSACASSTMSTSWGGNTAPSLAMSAPSRWRFTTTRSAACAAARARSAKHSAPDGQRKAPGHSSEVTLSVDHSCWSGSASSSARSPVAVRSAQAKISRTCAARAAGAGPSGSSTPWVPARRDSPSR